MVALSALGARVGKVFPLLSFFKLDVSGSNYKGLGSSRRQQTAAAQGALQKQLFTGS
jgi:hypothetical protein